MDAAAVRFTDSDAAVIQQVFGDRFYVVARFGDGAYADLGVSDGTTPPNIVGGVPVTLDSMTGQALLERRTLHVPDVASAVETEYPGSRRIHLAVGHRSAVYTPLLSTGTVHGVLSVQRRVEQRAYTSRQIALMETFADQAVIAIENARLFEAVEQRNTELQESNRQVTEALEQQTATAEILRVIASSPTELEPVVDAVLSSALRLSESVGG
jgi:two-component system, NtrC family, sensor kinase